MLCSELQRLANMNSGCVSAARRGQLAEFQTPKARRRRQKLHADPLSSIAGLSLIHHAALLLFQGFRIRQNDHFAVVNLVLQHQQSAMRVHHHGLAGLFEFLSVVRAALCLRRASCGMRARCACVLERLFRSYRHHRTLQQTPSTGPQDRCSPQATATRLRITSLPANSLPVPSSCPDIFSQLIPPSVSTVSPSQSARGRRTGTLSLR